MITRVTTLLVGKSVSRTASLIIGGASENIVEGEVTVLDKNKEILAVGSTINDTDTIYIVQALGSTITYANEAGTSFTVKRLRYSNPIEGALVRGYYANPHIEKAERVVSIAAISDTVVVGREYVLRIVYKDVKAVRGQFTKTYRFVATAATSTNVYVGLAAAVTADGGARITATHAGTTTPLIITGKAIPECTTGLTDIDNFSMVDFDVFLGYVNSDGYITTVTAVQTKTAAEYGCGNWEQLRDMEKASWAQEGVRNMMQFPVVLPTSCIVVGTDYDLIVIEHDKSYKSPEDVYKTAPMTTVVAFVDGAAQLTDVLAVLNTWMESCPKGLNSISF